MKFNLFATAVIMSSLVAVGCSDSNFQGASPTKKKTIDATPVNRTIQLSCDQVTGDSRLATSFSGEKPLMVSIEGELCGIQAEQVDNSLSVFFILDFSGSMESMQGSQGNDPVVGQSCGRLDAASAIAAKMEQSEAAGVKVQLGAMQFATSAQTHIPMTDLASFKSSLTVDNFCNGETATNYEAAFKEAQTQVSSISGRKLVYFITDGAPSAQDSFLDTPEKAGLSAAEAFRNSTQDLALNAIYLNASVGAGNVTPGLSFNPQEYLGQIVGNPNNVKLVSNAADMAAEILEFDTPDAVTLQVDTANMVHAAAQFGQNDVKLVSLEADPQREGVWKFVTEPILLFAEKGTRVTNVITLNVRTSGGEEHEAVVEVEFEHTESLIEE